MAGILSFPSRKALYKWWTPVVVSSETPRIPIVHEVRLRSGKAEALSVTGEVLGVFLMDDSREIASIVEDHVKRLSILETRQWSVGCTIGISSSVSPLPGEDGHTGSSNAILG